MGKKDRDDDRDDDDDDDGRLRKPTIGGSIAGNAPEVGAYMLGAGAIGAGVGYVVYKEGWAGDDATMPVAVGTALGLATGFAAGTAVVHSRSQQLYHQRLGVQKDIKRIVDAAKSASTTDEKIARLVAGVERLAGVVEKATGPQQTQQTRKPAADANANAT